MRKIYLLAFFALFISINKVKSQAVLGLSMLSFQDTLHDGDSNQFLIGIYNLSNNFPHSASTVINVAVDSTGGGGQIVPVYADTSFMVIPPGGIHYHQVQLTTTPVFKHGINIVIIWPKNEAISSPSFVLVDTLKVPVLVQPAVGINDIEEINSSSLMMFPNPTSGTLYFKSLNPNFEPEWVRVYDMYGRLVINQKNTGMLNLADVAAGTYSMEVISKRNVSRRYKIIKE